MKRDFITAAIGIVVLTLFCGILYPLVITGISQVAFNGNANGQQVKVNGKLVGSKLIGQNFSTQVVKNGKPEVDKNGNPVTNPDPRYFQITPLSNRPAQQRGRDDVLQPRPQQHRHRAGDLIQHPGLHRAQRAVLPRQAQRSRRAGRRRQHLGLGHRP